MRTAPDFAAKPNVAEGHTGNHAIGGGRWVRHLEVDVHRNMGQRLLLQGLLIRLGAERVVRLTLCSTSKSVEE